MLIGVKQLEGYSIHAKDGEIGKVDEFYFDDEQWTIRYLVVETGSWLLERRVLISPVLFGSMDRGGKAFSVGLTKKQVEGSPDIDTHKPVSRQQEIELGNYYNWPSYWAAAGLNSAGAPVLPVPLIPVESPSPGAHQKIQEQGDQHLRSTHEVIGYRIQATDGELGHVDDFLVEDDSWTIRYVVVDTKNWLPGKKVIIAPDWIKRIDWSEERVHVDMKRKEIQNGPEYSPDKPVTREHEEKLYTSVGRKKYWKG